MIIPAEARVRFGRKISPLKQLVETKCASAEEVASALLFVWARRIQPNQAPRRAPNKTVALVADSRVSTFVDWLCTFDKFEEAAYWVATSYATLVGEETRTQKALYFTHPVLAERVIDGLLTQGASLLDDHWHDPACGGAAFLVPVALRMRNALLESGCSPQEVVARINKNLSGNDTSRTLIGFSESTKYFLNDKSPRIGQWFFTCEAGHKAGDTWLQNDEETTEILGDECLNRPPRWRRMEPVSYRATASFYPHSDQFIVFGEEQQKLLELLREERSSELASSLASWYGTGAAPLTTEEILEVLKQKGAIAQLSPYKALEAMLSSPMAESNKEELRKVLATMVESWRAIPDLIPVRTEAPPAFLAQVLRRQSYGSRYDPVLLAVEHEALKRGTLEVSTLPGERAPFVLFTAPDKVIGPRDEEQLSAQTTKTKGLATRLGIDKIGLIREFELCRFTHGYTRMSSEPIIEKKDSGTLRLPVRLNLFDPFKDSRKRPIYTVTQKNEAIYVQLSPEQVFAWLKELKVADLPEWSPKEATKLNAHLLERAQPFGRFFSDLTPADASTYRYCYTLLHTYAHVVMKAVSEFSGLDMGSLSEYIFPCDLAFVVYRNATTMDLGYMSALWRNSNTDFLEHLGSHESLQCGSGSLCETKGGACPDCIVVPETSCIASNRLLSRSVLGGGLAPREDATNSGKRIPGYLEVIARNGK